jgi:transcription antitermination factor NusG
MYRPAKREMAALHSTAASHGLRQSKLSNAEAYDRPQWYVVYTNGRHEKKVAELLGNRQMNAYLPLYRSVRRWQDRQKEVELPLFPGYVFVRIALRTRLQVLTVPGVVRIVTFNGKPAPIDDSQIDALRQGLSSAKGVKPHPYLNVGKPVRVRSGPFAGMNGILVRRKQQYRLVLSIDLIMRSLSVEIDEAEVEPVN